MNQLSSPASGANSPYAEQKEDPVTVGYRQGKALPFASVSDMSVYIQKFKCYVDATFLDPLGMIHHFTMSAGHCDLKMLEMGIAFDGSSIRLFKSIEESDMLLIPDPSSCWIDPFMKHSTLHVVCNVRCPDGSYFDRCPRSICQRAETIVKGSGICSDVVVGPEVEFFLFDSVRFGTDMNNSFFEVDTVEGYWNTGVAQCTTKEVHRRGAPDFSVPGPSLQSTANTGHRMLRKQYYAPSIPIDSAHDLRNDMLHVIEQIGINTEKHHHEVACAQQELGITASTMLETADNVVAYKYCVKNCAAIAGKTVTFMPKPLAGDNGSGMHLHASLWQDGANLFYDENAPYQQLSQIALYFIGGLLKHAPALLAFCCPSVNSYKRLTPGFEAPSILSFSAGNRSACVRIPIVGDKQWRAKRMEFRCPDPLANPYLAIAGLILAGVDGIKNKIEAPQPLDVGVESVTSEVLEAMATRATPASLWAALEELEADCDFLIEGGAFTKDFISAYIAYKKAEYKAVTMVPTPKEYEFYYGA